MSNRLEVGMIVSTNYGTGPYQIVRIKRNCDCPNYVELINNPSGARRSKRHIHITCRPVNLPPNKRNELSYLNGYDEKTLRNVWNKKDRLIIRDDVKLPKPIQITMDLGCEEEEDEEEEES